MVILLIAFAIIFAINRLIKNSGNVTKLQLYLKYPKLLIVLAASEYILAVIIIIKIILKFFE